MIDLLLGLLVAEKLLKCHWDGQFLLWSSQMYWQETLLWVFHSDRFLSIFVYISGSIWLIALIWASLERSFPPAEVEYRCQFWSKVMTSEVEERPRLITAGYRWHRSQWVKAIRQTCSPCLDPCWASSPSAEPFCLGLSTLSKINTHTKWVECSILNQTTWKLLKGNIHVPFPKTFSLFLLSQCYELYPDYVVKQSFYS